MVDPCLYPGTKTLRNLFDEEDPEALAELEAAVSSTALADILLDPVKETFDQQHMCAIHRRLFQDIYPFAGELRTVTLHKEETVLSGRSVRYADPGEITSALKEALGELSRFRWGGDAAKTSGKAFAQIAAQL